MSDCVKYNDILKQAYREGALDNTKNGYEELFILDPEKIGLFNRLIAIGTDRVEYNCGIWADAFIEIAKINISAILENAGIEHYFISIPLTLEFFHY